MIVNIIPMLILRRISCTINLKFTCLFAKTYYSNRSFRVIMQRSSKAHLRIFDEDSFGLSFTVCTNEQHSENKVKVYQFKRNLSEPVSTLLHRISIKINAMHNQKKKKTGANDTESLITAMPVFLLKDDELVRSDVLCKDIFQDQKTSKITLKIGDQNINLLINNPWVEKLVLPSNVMVGFPAYPNKIDLRYSNEDESEFLWFRKNKDSKLNADTLIHSGFVYVPSVQDIGYNLKLVCTPKQNDVAGETVETVSSCLVEAGPGPCPFENRHYFTKECLSGNSFRVVSYNILANLYASSSAGKEELFTYCPQYAMKESYRKLLLLKELLGYNADLICLQEVDVKLFKKDLKKILKGVDMDGLMVKKGGQVQEGVACFYRKSRFKLVSSHELLLGGDSCNETYLGDIWKAVTRNESLAITLKEKTTCVQVLIFDYIENPNHRLIVANTHLYFHPDADHIRLLQAGMCLKLIDNLKNIVQSQEPNIKISVIFCGDFNSTPECGVYKLFTTNHIPEDYGEWKSEVFKTEVISGLSLKNHINFASACGTPEFTNFTPAFVGCLDYIFYQTEFLEVEQVVPLPSKEEVSQHTAIPSVVFPSDHVALVADLKLKENLCFCP